MSNGNTLPQAAPNPPADMRRIVIAGFIGGLVTPLIQPTKEYLTSHQIPSGFDHWFWAFALGLGIVGAVIVWLLKETDVYKALILGLSLPAFFTSLGGAVQNTADKPTITSMEQHKSASAPLGIILPSANAQPGLAAAKESPPSRSIEISVEGQPFAYKLELLDSKGIVIGEPVDVSAAESLLVAKPLLPSAAAARFTVDDQAPTVEKFDAKEGSTVVVTLHGTKFTRRFSVAQALGKTPDFVPDGVSATVEVKPKTPVGAQGWIYVGVFRSGSWQSEHTVEGTDLPKAGEIKQMIYSANLREAPGLANRAQSIVWVFQRVRIIDVTNIRDTTWAQVEVVG
jgi:hypothetical protein